MKNHRHFVYFSILILTGFGFTSCEKEIIPQPEQAQQQSVKRGVSYNFLIPEEDANLLGQGVNWFYNWVPNITDQANMTPAVAAQKWAMHPP